MEFERLVSSLDAEALARAAETLLRLLSGDGTAARGSFLSASGPEGEAWRSGASPLSAPGAARPLSGAPGAEQYAPPAAGTEETARAKARSIPEPGRNARSPDAAAETEARLEERLEERLAAVSERNRRSLGAGTETGSPYSPAPGSAAADAGAAGPLRSPAFPAPRAASFGAAAIPGEAETEALPLRADAAERDYFDAEAVSEFFRRDSRRYDSVFSD